LSNPQPASHRNNFGLLRLVFASLVIVSHSFEIIDGNRLREPLARVFGTLTVAEVAVAGFFIVSGYLISQSYETSGSVLSYLWKRILRIYPAFIAASLLCIVIVGPLAGANLGALTATNWTTICFRSLALQIPHLPDVFTGQHYPSLNGSMWTIAYEFRCYLALVILGCLGLLRGKIVLPLTVFFWLVAILTTPDWPKLRFEAAFGDLHETARLTAFFLTGTAFYLFRDRISYRNAYAAFAAAGLALALFYPRLVGPGVAIFGGYLIFWFAFLPGTTRLNAINSKTDISYGVYLYAWPIQMLLIRYVAGVSAASVIVVTMITSAVLAYASWLLVERPAMSQKTLLPERYHARRSLNLSQSG
jgi:peptidoglycan/LPS O-acetylase OafA/YrhL